VLINEKNHSMVIPLLRTEYTGVISHMAVQRVISDAKSAKYGSGVGWLPCYISSIIGDKTPEEEACWDRYWAKERWSV